jgi:arylsulfatase A-like enzyme
VGGAWLRGGSRGATVEGVVPWLVLPFLLAIACNAPTPPASDVVIVTWDTVRADHVGPAAAPERPYAAPSAAPAGASPTPRLDALAREGVAFLEARTPVPITLPAHASLLTGLYPHHHGARDNGQFRVAESAPTLAAHFRDSGYATGAFVSSAVLARGFGLDRGFDVYDDALTVETGNRTVASRRADQTVSAALGWLETLPDDRPAFLWVHLFAPHRPWRAPDAFTDRFDPYRAEIAFADAETGRLLDALSTAGRLDSALVVVTSDHGEGLGEHGEGTHSYFAYDSTLRVPLVFWAGPDAEVAFEPGARVAGPAALVDVAPTLATAAGVGSFPADGRSLADALGGEAPIPLRALPFESVVPALDYATAPIFGVVDVDGEAWIDAPRRERYDLSRDPAQRQNRYRASDTDAADAIFGSIERAWPPAAAPIALDDATRSQLEALGYASDAEAVTLGTSDIDPKDRIALFDFKSLGAETLGLEETLQRIDALRAEHGQVLALERFRTDTLLALGRRREAIETLEEAVRTHPGSTALERRANALQRERDEKRALADTIAAALERDPDHPTARRDLALTLHQLEDWSEARSLYEDWLDRHPEDDASRANLARLLASTGAPETALASLAERRFQPGHAVELDCLAGRLLAETLERAPEALAALRSCEAGGGRLTARGRAVLAEAADTSAPVPAAPAP